MTRLLIVLFALAISPMLVQADQPRLKLDQGNAVSHGRRFAKVSGELVFDPALKPFYHGVASGDPLTDRVILWTRVTPDAEGPVTVTYRVATDVAMTTVVKTGEVTTDQSRDYTVKVDVTGLEAGKTYYYFFTALGRNSLIGRTKTAPSTAVQRLRFGVASCANYQQGFFNSYAAMADRNDLDAVLFLGDYIYEYATGGYGYNDSTKRGHEPQTEIVTLADYRVRYAYYRLDPDLRRIHQQLPFINIWDDHESTNDSYVEGAENHQPDKEGDWNVRKNISKQVFFEWLPVRTVDVQNPTRIYRTFSYGPLADIFMLDTRLEGREKPLAPKDTASAAVDTAIWNAPNRTLLGAAQYQWLTDQTKASTATWKILGNQVMMMPARGIVLGQLDLTNQDSWDGYPAERQKLLEFWRANNVNNIVVVTGDIHSTWVGDLIHRWQDPNYNATTGAGSYGTEMVTPSIVSANINELLRQDRGSFLSLAATSSIRTSNPHMKEVELDNHGYFVLTLTPERAQGDWYFVDTIYQRTKAEKFHKAFFNAAGTNRIQAASAAIPTDPNAPAATPLVPPTATSVNDGVSNHVMIIGNYPNPVMTTTKINYALNTSGRVRVQIYDMSGQAIANVFDGTQEPGIYTVAFDASSLPAGVYTYKITTAAGALSRQMTVVK